MRVCMWVGVQYLLGRVFHFRQRRTILNYTRHRSVLSLATLFFFIIIIIILYRKIIV